MEKKISVFWFRRDLCLEDNIGLSQALKLSSRVLPIFIFDREIISQLPEIDARVTFIHETISKINSELKKEFNSSMGVYFGRPLEIFGKLIVDFEIEAIYTNRDYEPYALKRDKQIKEFLTGKGILFHTYKNQVIFERDEVVKADGNPYVVYTPYKNKWKEKFHADNPLKQIDGYPTINNFIQDRELPFPTLGELGFKESAIKVPDYVVSDDLIDHYGATRNFPAKTNGTSRIGPHLRFGTVSIRNILKKAITSKNEVFWNELIWREFFMQILWHFPRTVNNAFKPKYDRIVWRNNGEEFEKWKNGQTGYPLVDAGMRQLNETGYMHNRVRMLAASFLCKHLLIDWRWGEAYFAEKLLDFELSSNVGNWQWAAGSGVDAAPYFRIFNPTTQIRKFDKQQAYINQWVPEVQGLGHPTKMVDHKAARERCLKVYKEALG
ncbi:MAG: deoxyribodipyrimidine photolyase [Maribacter sp.]|nr:MAG: deoxyribodipyrimidine photolyase [Maribacter sp.]